MMIERVDVKVLVLGGDGYLGWPTSLHFSARGHEVALVDSFLRRTEHARRGSDSLTPILPLEQRVARWEQVSGVRMPWFELDITDQDALYAVIADFRPDTIIDYAELPSAPYSMIDCAHAVRTQRNNVEGTLNVIWAMRELVPDAHLVKLGTMGEYGTPNIDIEEGYIEITHKGRRDRMTFPKRAGSFYHLSKVHDSHNLEFAARIWGLRVTDLNQGVVHGIETAETILDPGLINRFDYDEIFGTALNRFCVQAMTANSLTVYGSGRQRRGFLNIRDTLQCVELAALNPAAPGQFRVFNQFTEVFSILELAEIVAECAHKDGYEVTVEHLHNPRIEAEDHYYNPSNQGLLDLGLKPILLSTELLESTLSVIRRHRDRLVSGVMTPSTSWS
ncbi:NAD-dependent epimerase/dehydratase family protein [Micromonosporaceae bacterium B7E4]